MGGRAVVDSMPVSVCVGVAGVYEWARHPGVKKKKKKGMKALQARKEPEASFNVSCRFQPKNSFHSSKMCRKKCCKKSRKKSSTNY